jgi:hypothetical protein
MKGCVILHIKGASLSTEVIGRPDPGEPYKGNDDIRLHGALDNVINTPPIAPQSVYHYSDIIDDAPYRGIGVEPHNGAGDIRNLDRQELLQFLNELLEAERAGAKALLRTAMDTDRKDFSEMAKAIHRDEARWCAMLTRAIRDLDGEPSPKTGAFYEKVMAIPEDGPRLAFVNRGQGWVVRKLREILPRIKDVRLSCDLTEMLISHEANIKLVTDSGLIG